MDQGGNRFTQLAVSGRCALAPNPRCKKSQLPFFMHLHGRFTPFMFKLFQLSAPATRRVV